MESIIFAQASARGRRHEKNGMDNQDRLFCYRLGTGYFFGCWDGISAFGERGGEAAQIAADITCQVLDHTESFPADARRFLISLVETIHDAIMTMQPSDGPVIGTTMTACLIDPTERLLHIVHVGNSPVLITQCGTNLHKITKDDIDRFNAGALSRWLGSGLGVDENTLYLCTKLGTNEAVVLCTDGVTHAYNGKEQEIGMAIMKSCTIPEMEETACTLVEYAHDHSLDDVSIICVKLNGHIEGMITPEAKEEQNHNKKMLTQTKAPEKSGFDEVAPENTVNRHNIRSMIIALLIGLLTGYSIALFAERCVGRPPALHEPKEPNFQPTEGGNSIIDSVFLSPYLTPTDSL